MNDCGYGDCVCGGWTDDFGWHPCDKSQRYSPAARDGALIQRYYFWSTEHNVVLSVDHRTDRDGRVAGVDYYLTPIEAANAAKTETIKRYMDKGLLDPEEAKRLLGLRPVLDSVPPPPKQGPRGQRRRHFDVKPKPNRPA